MSSSHYAFQNGSLMEQMSKAYQESVPAADPKWEQGNICAVLSSHGATDKSWYRARVDVVDGDKLDVFLLDYGHQVIATATDVRPLKEEFMEKACYCMRCHFAELQPAGDSSKWSQTACEFLVEELTDQQCFLVQMGDMEAGSLPIDLLIPEVIKGDALTSDQVKFNSVGERLRDQGLALAKRK